MRYDEFLDDINLNRIGGYVIAHNSRLAAEKGELRFSVSCAPTDHVLRAKEDGCSVTVLVEALDVVAAGHSPAPKKFDVEGFEQEVIRGAKLVFQPFAIGVDRYLPRPGGTVRI